MDDPNLVISSVLQACSNDHLDYTYVSSGITAENIDWSLQTLETVIPGQATSVSLDNTVFFKEGNPELSGSGLWRMGLYGSKSADGSGDRFGYVSQTLSSAQAGTTLNANSALQIDDAVTDFEIGSVGCNDYGYTCVEFTGGDDPDPNYFFRVEGAIDASKEANTITKCKEQECLSSKHFFFLCIIRSGPCCIKSYV